MLRIEQADVHFITVSCASDIGDSLVKEGFLEDEPEDEDVDGVD